jgi:hypothetical protein
MDNPMIELRGQRVPLTQASYMRGWFVYQGGDYFEFRADGPDGWHLSQSGVGHPRPVTRRWARCDPAGRRRGLRALHQPADQHATGRTGHNAGM